MVKNKYKAGDCITFRAGAEDHADIPHRYLESKTGIIIKVDTCDRVPYLIRIKDEIFTWWFVERNIAGYDITHLIKEVLDEI